MLGNDFAVRIPDRVQAPFLQEDLADSRNRVRGRSRESAPNAGNIFPLQRVFDDMSHPGNYERFVAFAKFGLASSEYAGAGSITTS